MGEVPLFQRFLRRLDTENEKNRGRSSEVEESDTPPPPVVLPRDHQPLPDDEVTMHYPIVDSE